MTLPNTTHVVDADVLAYLSGKVINCTLQDGSTQAVTLTQGTNLFLGPIRMQQGTTVPVLAVFVLATGGPPPEPYFASTTAGTDGANQLKYEAGVQVTVRSDPDEYQQGRDLARGIADALNLATISGYIECKLMQAVPVYTGMNSTQNHTLRVNAQLWFIE